MAEIELPDALKATQKTRFFVLANGMRVLLVSDSVADKAAAAVDVGVGSMFDDPSAPGLAHFCEHLLFMGSEKYPNENEYSSYLAAHAGSSNAFTSADHTNYYFDVASDHLEGALDRFLQFFIAPLFAKESVDRELNAVDSEHKKNIQADGWRIHQLHKDLMDTRHAYSTFSTGNLETLKDGPRRNGIDIRDLVMDFHAKYYSAGIMTLVVLGKKPLDTLQDWIVSKTAGIKNTGNSRPHVPGHPLLKEHLLKQISIKPVKDFRSIQLTFPLPNLKSQYRCKPSRYASHLIGHESEGSVLAYLKQKGWAQSLSAGSGSSIMDFGFFTISVSLTDEGQKHWEEIVALIFQYIEMVKRAGVQDWIYEEERRMSEVMFRFSEKSNPSSFVSRVAGDMHDYEGTEVLSGPSVLFEMDIKQIEDVLAALNVDNFRITLIFPDFESSVWSKARWYGTEYLVEDFSPALKKSLSIFDVPPFFHLPRKNEFIPENFQVRKINFKPAKRPDIVYENDVIRLWHKKDDTFWVPKAKVKFSLKSPLCYVTPSTCVLTRLYTDCLMDALNEYSYYASVAGLDYDISNSTDGIDLSISGYNDKLHVLLLRIIQTAKSLKIDTNRFASVKEYLTRSYKNWAMDQPYQHASFFASYLTQERLWTSEEKLDVLKDLTAHDVETFYPTLLGALFIEGLAFGNLEVEESAKLAIIIQEELKCKSLPSQCRSQTVRTHIIPSGKHFIYNQPVPNPNQLNSAIEYLIQVGELLSDNLRVKTMLFAQAAKEPCFNVLRTKEQLGYIVFSGVRKQTGMISFRILVQSEKDPKHLEARAEAFLIGLKDTILSMSDDEFKKHKDAVATNLLESDKNLSQEANRHWSHISNGYYDFDWDELDAERVVSVTRDELLEFFDEYISPASRTRSLASICLWSEKASAESTSRRPEEQSATTLQKNVVGIREVSGVKAAMTLTHGPVPSHPLPYFKLNASKI